MRVYLLFFILFMSLWSISTAQESVTWNFQSVLPADSSVTGLHGLAFGGNGTVWAGPYFSLGPDNDLIPEDRINPVYCIDPATKELCEDVPFIIGTMTADTLLRFGPITGMASAPDGTVLISVHGFRTGPDGATWNSSRAFVHRIDPATGEGLGVGEITDMRTETASQAFHISADGFGNIYYSTVFPGQPIRVMDKDFQFISNVSENRSGFARTIAANPAGTRVYQPNNYVSRIVEGTDTIEVGGRVEVHEGNVHTGFAVLDTMSIIGMDPGASFVCPITDALYVPASGSGGNPEGDPDGWQGMNIYGINVLGQDSIEVVDVFTWQQGDGDPFNPIYRALAMSGDGLDLVVGGFSSNAHVQYFSRDAAPDSLIKPGQYDLNIIPSTDWVIPDSLFILDVYVGSQNNPIEDLHGIGFQVIQSDLNFEFEEVIPGDLLADDPQDLILFQEISGSGLSVDVSLSRKSDSGVSGYGKLVSIVYRSAGPFEDTHAFTFEDVLALNSNGQPIDMDPAGLEVRYNTTTVWPGDTNNDGVVDMLDLLPIGQYYGLTGPAREPFNVSWSGLIAELWEVPQATYSDATGDGRINQNDVLPIGLNYGKTWQGSQAKRVAANSKSDPEERSLFVDVDALIPGDILHITIGINKSLMPEDGILGLATMITSDAAALPYFDLKIPAAFGSMENLLVFSYQDEDKVGQAVALSRKRPQGLFAPEQDKSILELELEVNEHISPFRLLFENSHASTLKDIRPADFLNVSASIITSTENRELVREFSLMQNYPNPFNPSTRIGFSVPQDAHVQLTVHNLLGQKVATLIDERKSAGRHNVTFDASRLSSGLYIYRMQADGFVETRQMLFVK